MLLLIKRFAVHGLSRCLSLAKAVIALAMVGAAIQVLPFRRAISLGLGPLPKTGECAGRFHELPREKLGSAAIDQQAELERQRLYGPIGVNLPLHRPRSARTSFCIAFSTVTRQAGGMRLGNHFRRAITRGLEANLRLAEASAVLTGAATVIRFRPFRGAVNFGSIPVRQGHVLTAEMIDELAQTVRSVARRLPFRALCFEQGLALQRMLRRRGVDAYLNYGIGKKGADLIEAHVWVTAGDRVVIGEQGSDMFRAVGVFP